MADPCMICGCEANDGFLCHQCHSKSMNVVVCKKHYILHWKHTTCPMCKMGIPETPFTSRNGYDVPSRNDED